MLRHFVRIWLVIAVVDAAFSSALSVFAYHSTVGKLWQGVASTVLGASAMEGGAVTVVVGLLLHLLVALVWSAVFLTIATRVEAVRRLISTWPGILLVAAIYGPLIWLVMSMVVIPLASGHARPVNARWWIQFFGHMAFVALPIILMTAREMPAGGGKTAS